jgi:hypothetical protein
VRTLDLCIAGGVPCPPASGSGEVSKEIKDLRYFVAVNVESDALDAGSTKSRGATSAMRCSAAQIHAQYRGNLSHSTLDTQRARILIADGDLLRNSPRLAWVGTARDARRAACHELGTSALLTEQIAVSS